MFRRTGRKITTGFEPGTEIFNIISVMKSPLSFLRKQKFRKIRKKVILILLRVETRCYYLSFLRNFFSEDEEMNILGSLSPG